MIRCSVVIVTYNSSRVIEKCIAPLLGDDRVQVVVVDNASTDRTLEIVEAHAEITVVRNHENVGFAQAVNAGALRASGAHILLLNPDAVVSADDVHRLAARLDAHPGWGIVAPMFQSGDSPFQTLNAGFEPSLWRMFTHMSGLSKISALAPSLEYAVGGHYFYAGKFSKSPRNADWVSGGCMMVRKAVWDDAAGLSSRWFMYAEDIEFCNRVKSLGWSVVLDPSVRATHDIGGSSLNVDGKLGATWLSNLYDYYRWRLTRSPLESYLWIVIVRSGFYLRSGVSRVIAIVSPRRRARAAYNAQRFVNYARFAVPAVREYCYVIESQDGSSLRAEGGASDVSPSEGLR